MGLVYLPTFTININQMWINTAYMHPMGYHMNHEDLIGENNEILKFHGLRTNPGI